MNSRYDHLLDEETHPVWGKYLRSNEEILWEGSPQIDMSIRLLDSGGYHDVMTGASSNLILYLVFLFVVARVVYGETGLVSAIPFFLFGGVLVLVFEVLRNRSNKKIRYAVTTHFLLIKYDYFVFKKIAAIPLSKVISIAPIKYEDGTTTLLFPNYNERRIKTIDFVTGKRRDHTSFEHIADGDKVIKLITHLIKDNELPPLQYQHSMMSESVVSVTRKIYQLLIFVSVFYMVNFYLLTKGTYRMSYTGPFDIHLNPLGKYAAIICFITFLSGGFILNKRPLSQESYTQLVVCTVFFLILFWVVNNWL